MGAWQRPALPEGALKDLNDALHRLHGQSGYLSSRKIADRLAERHGPGAPSHTRVHHLFTKPELPKPELMLWIVDLLAGMIRSLDPEETCDRFDALWQRAFDEQEEAYRRSRAAPAAVPDTPVRRTGSDSDAAHEPDRVVDASDVDVSYDDDSHGYVDDVDFDESADAYAGDGSLAGPYDEDEAPDDDIPRLDLGSVRLPLPPDAQVQVEIEQADGALRAVHVLTPNGQFTVSAYAAPRSGKLWSEISRELADQLHGDGAQVRREFGEWGAELVAVVDGMLLRFVGVDGPRWMLRAVSTGPRETSAKAAEELRDMVRGTVVCRGQQPMPVRTPLPLSVPETIAQHIDQAQNPG